MKRVFAGETVLDTRYLEFFGNQIAFAIVPVFEADGSVEMAVMAYRTMSEIHVAALGMSMTLIVGVALAMLLSTVFAWFISRRFTQPLVSMNQTALRMAEGHYGDRVTVSARDEIGVLGGTLNLLSGRLDGVIANLRAEKRKLEQILLSLGEGVIAVDTEGEVMHGNLPALEVLEVLALVLLLALRPRAAGNPALLRITASAMALWAARLRLVPLLPSLRWAWQC